MYTACPYKLVPLSMVIMLFWNYNVANLAIIFGASSVEVIVVFFYRFGNCGEGSRRGQTYYSRYDSQRHTNHGQSETVVSSFYNFFIIYYLKIYACLFICVFYISQSQS